MRFEWEEAITFHNLGTVVLRATLSHFHPNFPRCEGTNPSSKGASGLLLLLVTLCPGCGRSHLHCGVVLEIPARPRALFHSMGMWEPFPCPSAAASAEKAGEGMEKERKIIQVVRPSLVKGLVESTGVPQCRTRQG